MCECVTVHTQMKMYTCTVLTYTPEKVRLHTFEKNAQTWREERNDEWIDDYDGGWCGFF